MGVCVLQIVSNKLLQFCDIYPVKWFVQNSHKMYLNYFNNILCEFCTKFTQNVIEIVQIHALSDKQAYYQHFSDTTLATQQAAQIYCLVVPPILLRQKNVMWLNLNSYTILVRLKICITHLSLVHSGSYNILYCCCLFRRHDSLFGWDWLHDKSLLISIFMVTVFSSHGLLRFRMSIAPMHAWHVKLLIRSLTCCLFRMHDCLCILHCCSVPQLNTLMVTRYVHSHL